MFKRINLLLVSASALTLIAVAPLRADAADAAADSTASNTGEGANSVETITVLGSKSTPTGKALLEIQHSATPASLFSAERLDAAAIVNIRELMRQSPGLAGVPANNFSDQEIFIRGIGEQDPQGEPSVGVYVDGVFMPKLLGTNQELLDIENIRIVRGPDGFDGGHMAEGGGIHIQTTVPDGTFKGVAEAGVGTFDEWKIGGAISGPIVDDKVFASVALSHHERDGINISLPNKEPGTDINYSQGRIKFRFTPTDDLEFISAFDGTNDHGTNYVDADLAAADGDHYDGHNPLYPKNDYTELGWTGTISYQIDEHLKLSSLTSVRGFSNQSYYDNYGDAFARSSQLLHYEDRAYSEDVKLSGDYDWFSFDGGVYAYHENWTTNRRANNGFGAGSVSRGSAILSPVDAFIDQDNTIYSAYLDSRIKITDALTAELGGRANYEIHANHEELYCLLPGAIGLTKTGSAFCPTSGVESTTDAAVSEINALANNAPGAQAWGAGGKARYASLTPKIALDYQWTPEILQYVSYSQQEKPGGFDYRGQTVGLAGASSIAASEFLASRQERIAYSPETLTTYETGVKTTLLDNRALLNLSAFYNDFHNIQLTTTDPSQNPPLTHRFNDGKAKSYGAELEATIYPAAGLEIYGFADYLFSRLDVVDSPTAIVYYGETAIHTAPFVGAKLPDASHWQGSLSVNYTLPLSIPGAIRVGSSLTFQGAYFTDTTNNVKNEIPRQTLVNALASYTSDDDHWIFQVTAKNLFNKRYPESLSYTSPTSPAPAAVAPPPAFYTTFYNDPRTFLFTVKYKY